MASFVLHSPAIGDIPYLVKMLLPEDALENPDTAIAQIILIENSKEHEIWQGNLEQMTVFALIKKSFRTVMDSKRKWSLEVTPKSDLSGCTLRVDGKDFEDYEQFEEDEQIEPDVQR